jgi:predicted MPP superfamily phosphohydrolase
MARGSLVAAIAWAVLVAASVVVAGRVRRRHAEADGGTDRPVTGVEAADLLVGGFAGVAGVVAIFLAVHFTVRFTMFGGIAIAYLVLVVGVPLAMVGVLVAAFVGRDRHGGEAGRVASRPAAVVCIAGLLLAPVGIYATHVEPGLLDVDRPAPLAVAEARSGRGAITIGVLTDLQTPVIGVRERAVVADLMAEAPDVILLPGDVVQADDRQFDRELPALQDLLRQLSAPGGVFLVGGDVDQPLDRLTRMVEGTGVRYLADEVVTTTVGDRTVTIGGLAVDYRSAGARAVVDQLEREPGDDDIRILLAHRPDPVLDLRPDSRIDLQVSGHTHGGQVSVPFIGPLMTLSSVPRHIAAGGLHDYAGNAVYVGHGVGLERGSAPQVRFGVRPDIGIVTIAGDG